MFLLKSNAVSEFIKDPYAVKDLELITNFLQERETFLFPALGNGLFPAAIVEASTEYTGYAAVWIRDNVFVAYAHYIIGETEIAIKTMTCLLQYFREYKNRFEDVINATTDPENVMSRPHVRFNGDALEEINQIWQQAQNDALGYFLWFFCKIVDDGILDLTKQDADILSLFPFYFKAISYWNDEDSGHWEEDRKIEASSIGIVIASLKSLRNLIMNSCSSSFCLQYEGQLVTVELLDDLIQKGTNALNIILPSECIQIGKERRYDAALLFLVYPMQIVNDEMADQIVADVVNNLQREHGILRYLGDSFWCHDYNEIPEEIRTSISAEREQWLMENRHSFHPATEAQWCIFDPILSIIFGLKYQKSSQSEFLTQQTFYLNRSLGQLTDDNFKSGGLKCPELYYLKGSEYIPNDATPLLWTQANLRIALMVMKQSLEIVNQY
jgi:hypothetical protein